MNNTKPPLLIFARTKKEADIYAMGDLGLDASEFRYISNPEYLRGCPRDLFCVKLHMDGTIIKAPELDKNRPTATRIQYPAGYLATKKYRRGITPWR